MEKLDATHLDDLLDALRASGRTIIGPKVRNGAIGYEPIERARDLPQGWTEEQEKGSYRLKRRSDNAYFGFTVGPQGWKRFLFAPKERLWKAKKDQKGEIHFTAEKITPPRVAFLGVRACDIAAISIQDRVFIEGQKKDSHYQSRRENALVVAVQCMTSAPTCFCASMQTGPEVRGGFDLSLVEVLSPQSHFFLIRSGTDDGESILKTLRKKDLLAATNTQEEAESSRQVEEVSKSQSRRLDPKAAVELLFRNHESPRWDEVASRCLNCANCTLVCPTCFCSSIEDTTDLSGENAERWRRWDSCFTLDHSHLHGGNVRNSAKSRYRQWLTHKLSTWVDQFGVSGCVGCGRCISWCPVGIDLTEEVEGVKRHEENR